MALPSYVRNLLWEYDLEDPQVMERLDRVIVERVMERGGWDSMRWLFGPASNVTADLFRI